MLCKRCSVGKSLLKEALRQLHLSRVCSSIITGGQACNSHKQQATTAAARSWQQQCGAGSGGGGGALTWVASIRDVKAWKQVIVHFFGLNLLLLVWVLLLVVRVLAVAATARLLAPHPIKRC